MGSEESSVVTRRTGKMVPPLLTDMPSAGFEAILNHLTPQDHANLRLVSRSMAKQTAQLLPSIPLKLFKDSTPQQLQQWFRATQHFHAPSIHVRITGEVPEEAFKLAMQLLSQRTTPLAELHLLAMDTMCSTLRSSNAWVASATSCATLQTLEPLRHLMASLQTLVIQGVTVQCFAIAIGQLAAAVTVENQWQLRRLVLNVNCLATNLIYYPPCFALALQFLTAAFRDLRHLELQVPQPALVMGLGCYQVEVAAAIVVAASQLKSLETLTITQLSDIWKQGFWLPGSPPQQDLSSAAAELTDKATVPEGMLMKNAPAVETLGTLDECGSFLIDNHPTLRDLTISTVWPWCTMAWQRKQQPCQTSSSGNTSSGCDAAAAGLLVGYGLQAVIPAPGTFRVRPPVGPPLFVNDASISGGESLSSACTRHLYLYSHQPASSLKSQISSLTLALRGHHLPDLADVLGDMKSLKDLELRVPPREPTGRCTATIAAAASIPSLESFSLVIVPDTTGLLATSDLLLPLTAAAGGPGSSLKKLKLVGDFQEDPTAAAAVSSDPQWHHALQQLTGLSELEINHRNYNRKLLDFSVDSIPVGLKKLVATEFNIVSAAASAAPALIQVPTAAADVGVTAAGSIEVKEDANTCSQTAANRCLALQSLYMTKCRLSSPSILASNQLQQLIVDDSSWPGGWTAAAAAWPNVKEVEWKYNLFIDHDSTDGPAACGSSEATSKHGFWAVALLPEMQDAVQKLPELEEQRVQEALTKILVGFKYLKSLSVIDLPWLSVEILQPLEQHLRQLQYIRLDVAVMDFIMLLGTRQSDNDGGSAGGSSSGSGGQGSDVVPDKRLVQRWLREELPWAMVCSNLR